MSSAPAGERRALDAYYTPDDLASALVSVLPGDDFAPLFGGPRMLEPSVGGGAFVRAWRARYPNAHINGRDLDPEAAGLALCDASAVGDFLDLSITGARWVVGNPPYRHAEAHVRHAIDVSGRYVAFLLRLAFLESGKRVRFWKQARPLLRCVWVLSERPSFTGGATDSAAYGWFLWDKQHTGPSEIRVLSWRDGVQEVGR